MSSDEVNWSIGSTWHRWDPHLHTPGTLFEDRYGSDDDVWERYLDAIEQADPPVHALGITDYCVLDSYKEFVRRAKDREGLQDLFVFPNVEFRLTVETEKKKGINLHLLFNPDGQKHVERIKEVLGQFTFKSRGETYTCTRELLRCSPNAQPVADILAREGVTSQEHAVCQGGSCTV